jgi:hypothetical protein
MNVTAAAANIHCKKRQWVIFQKEIAQCSGRERDKGMVATGFILVADAAKLIIIN